MGLSSSKSRSSSSSTANATVTPNVPAWIQGPAQSFYSQIGAMVTPGGASAVNPATGNQQSAFNGAQGLSGFNQALQNAIGGTQGLMGYTPGTVGANTISAPSAYNPERVSSQAITAGQLRDTDLSPYMNPYTQSVIDATAADMGRARDMAISSGQGAATRAGAYGGSRHGVMDAETNRGFIDQLGQVVSGLRSQGYQNAQNAALADINARYGADQFSASQAMQAALANQGAGLTAGLQANADRMNADQYNANARTQADQFNVNSGLAGANFRLGASNQLGSLGQAQDASTRANLGLQADLGAQERDIAQQNDPLERQMRYYAQLQALLGMDPSQYIGSNTQSSGTQTGTTKSSPSLLSSIGTIAQIGSSLFPSDRRVKRNIEPLWTDERGNNWYSFEYVWDEPGTKFAGVMADEAPAHAVHILPSGIAAVDYGAI